MLRPYPSTPYLYAESAANLPENHRPWFMPTDVFYANQDARELIVVNQGGARSSKSYSLAQLLSFHFVTKHHKKVLITRKTMPSLKLTAYRLVIEFLKAGGYYPYCTHNKTANTVEFGSNLLVFASIDDPEKIKSAEWNYAWFEEANEFSWTDFETVLLRMSGPTTPEEPNQIFLSFNPSDDQGWIRHQLGSYNPATGDYEIKRPDVRIIHSTYSSNPHLGADYKQILAQLKEQNPNSYQIYALGGYGTRLEVIYQWSQLPVYPDSFDDIVYGLDFGFNNPSVLVECAVRDNEVYLTEKIYETHLTNRQLIERVKAAIADPNDYIYCDSSEPDRIEEMCEAGLNAIPADKSAGSVKSGISLVQALKVYTHPANVNLNKEAQRYCWKKDKNGNLLDEPVKLDDHGMDAVRMALFTHLRQGQLIDPRITVLGRDWKPDWVRDEGHPAYGPADDGGFWFPISKF